MLGAVRADRPDVRAVRRGRGGDELRPTFALYNVVGGLIWVGICTLAGYAFGNVPIVKNNFSLFALGIVFVSVIPIGIEMIRHRMASSGR